MRTLKITKTLLQHKNYAAGGGFRKSPFNREWLLNRWFQNNVAAPQSIHHYWQSFKETKTVLKISSLGQTGTEAKLSRLSCLRQVRRSQSALSVSDPPGLRPIRVNVPD